jgi:hypothetical protein
VNCCNQLHKSPINSIIKSRTILISHANPGYATILNGCVGSHENFVMRLQILTHYPHKDEMGDVCNVQKTRNPYETVVRKPLGEFGSSEEDNILVLRY